MIHIVASGMMTALGMNSESSGAAIRASLSGFQEIPFVDGRGRLIVAAPARQHLGGLVGTHLLVEMACVAITECCGRRASDIPLLVATANRTAPANQRETRLLRSIGERLGQSLHPLSRQITSGGDACLQAVRVARSLLMEGRVDDCLVCGVDSLIETATLKRFERTGRLKNADNPDGLVPGEAAACLHLRRYDHKSESGALLIRGLGFSREDATIESGRPVLGVGLADAMRAALQDAGLDMEAVDYRISDATGERYGFVETNFALGRILRIRKPTFEFLHLMDSLGAIGAASGACMLAYAKFLNDWNAAPATGGFCETGSDDGARAVAVITRAPNEQ